jgi:hypothetical protein
VDFVIPPPHRDAKISGVFRWVPTPVSFLPLPLYEPQDLSDSKRKDAVARNMDYAVLRCR